MERGPFYTRIANTVQNHMNHVANITPNTSQFVRSWQTKLNDLLSINNASITQLLEKPMAEWPCLARQGDCALNPITDKSISDTIDSELGFSLRTVQENLQRVLEQYKGVVDSLFRANESLYGKLEKLSALQQKLEGLKDIEDGTAECLRLQTSILEYVQSQYSALQIKDDTREFCQFYARFLTLRSVLNILNGFGQHTGSLNIPVCTICMACRVNTAIVPCGHTFCEECSKKQRAQCFLCRTTIRDRQKLFFM